MTYKVAHLTSAHPRYDTRIFTKMCCSLAKHDISTFLIVADGKGDEITSKVNILDVAKVNTGRLARMTKTVYNVYKAALALNADVYHFHDPELMPVALILKVKGKKVIMDVHEDVPRQILRKFWLPSLLRKPIATILDKLEIYTANRVDAVVTVTPTIAKRFSRFNVVEVRNYVLLSEFDGTAALNYGPIDKTLVTYIGAISETRGIIPMVEAFTDLKYKFTLGGKFQGNGLLEQVQNMPSWSNVDFLGWQRRDDVAQLLDKSLVGLVVLQPTGDYEVAFPVKMFEYMAAGAAVVASNFPLWSDIIEKEECGICVDPSSATAIAGAIRFLIDNPEAAIEMGERGKKAVKQRYNWDGEFIKLLSLYEKILGR